jgi:hypothetical protein
MTCGVHSRARSLSLLVASSLLAATAAAQIVPVTPEGTVAFERTAQGLLSDTYAFSIDEGKALSFSALASFGPNNSSWIDEFAATLSEGGALLDTAQWRALPLFRWEELEFAPRVLGPGDYRLNISGVVNGEGEFPMTTYRLTMQFASAAVPIPEPGTFGLIVAGFLLMGVKAATKSARGRVV